METERKPLFDTFDWLVGIGAVPFQDPLIGIVAGLIVLSRHVPFLARGFFLLLGAREVTPLWCKVLPGVERYLMSNEETEDPSVEVVAGALPATPQSAGQLIAKPGNSVKSVLPGNDVAEEAGNGFEEEGEVSEYRKILHQQGALLALARLINAGKVGQTDAIVIGMGVKASGRSDSAYAQLRAQLLPLIKQPNKFPPLTPEQEQARKILEGV